MKMNKSWSRSSFLPLWPLCSLWLIPPLLAAEPKPLPKFDRIVIDANFPGGYQVEVADVNGDKKPDIVALGGGTCAWYENPSWKKRVITNPDQTPGIISSATADLDGDGKAEVAIAYEFAMNEPTKGKLTLAVQGTTVDEPWTLKPIADVGSIHRVRWGILDGDEDLDLVVAPIFGAKARPPSYNQAPAELVVFRRKGPRRNLSDWERVSLATRPVMHAIELVDIEGRTRVILTADNLGVGVVFTWGDIDEEFAFEVLPPLLGKLTIPRTHDLNPGAMGEAPKRGSSEVHGGLLGGGRSFLATIEPWHGNQVVIYAPDERVHPDPSNPGNDTRTVIDATLDDGHALWVADVDGDGDDEVFAGHRGKDHRVSAYDFDGKTWVRTVLDTEVAAQDLRGGDLDGDGTPDVVAIGGKTHNVVWYRPRREAKP